MLSISLNMSRLHSKSSTLNSEDRLIAFINGSTAADLVTIAICSKFKSFLSLRDSIRGTLVLLS